MKTTTLASLLLCAACAHLPPVARLTPQPLDDSLVVGTAATGERPAGPGEIEFLGGLLVGRLPEGLTAVKLAEDGPWPPEGILDVSVFKSTFPQGGKLLINVRNDFTFSPNPDLVALGSLADGLGFHPTSGDPRLELLPHAFGSTGDSSEPATVVLGAQVVMPERLVFHVLLILTTSRKDEIQSTIDKAQELIHSLRVGPRRLDLSAGTRALHDHLSMALPAGYAIHYARVHDEDVYRIERPRREAEDGGHVRVQLFDKLGRPLSWKGWHESGGHLFEREIAWHSVHDVQGAARREAFVPEATAKRQAFVVVEGPEETVERLTPYVETLGFDTPAGPPQVGSTAAPAAPKVSAAR